MTRDAGGQLAAVVWQVTVNDGTVEVPDPFPDAGHSFLNDLEGTHFPVVFVVMGAFNDPSAPDARRRITAFFDRHPTTAPERDGC